MCGCNGYGDTGAEVIYQAHRPSGVVTALAGGGATATILISNPYEWTARSGKCGGAGCSLNGSGPYVRLTWSSNSGNDSLVSITTAVVVLDGDGNILRTEPVGEFDAITLGSLQCGDLGDTAQPECPLFPFPTRKDGRGWCIGVSDKEQFALVITNDNVLTVLYDVEAAIDIVPCKPRGCMGCGCDEPKMTATSVAEGEG